MRMRTIAGGVLVAGVAIGALLSGLFEGAGWGPGEGGAGGSGNTETVVGVPDSKVTPTEPQPETETQNNPPESDLRVELPPVEPTDRLAVLIEGNEYFLDHPGTSDRDWIPITIDQLEEYATRAEGDADGVRMTVYRRPSAKALAEEQLKQKLAEWGVPATEVDWYERPFTE